MLHIFIVSLKQDVKKREAISTVLDGFNISFTFIDAIYGKELPIDYLNSIIVKSSGNILKRGFLPTPGEVGCTLSHLKVYREVLSQGIEWACILEDDAILNERFEQFIKGFTSNNLKKDNLYLLGGQNGLSAEKLIVKSYKNFENIAGQKFYKTIKSEAFIYRTCCYLISSELAGRLLHLAESRFILADDWDYLVKNNIINNIYLSDFVSHPSDLSNSHIQSERVAKSSSNNRIMAVLYKKFKNLMYKRARLTILKSYRFLEKKD